MTDKQDKEIAEAGAKIRLETINFLHTVIEDLKAGVSELAIYSYVLTSSKMLSDPASDYSKGYTAGWLDARQGAGEKIKEITDRLDAISALEGKKSK